MTDPWARPADQASPVPPQSAPRQHGTPQPPQAPQHAPQAPQPPLGGPVPPGQVPPPPLPAGGYPPPPPPAAPQGPAPQQQPAGEDDADRSLLRDPLSLVLIGVIVVALVAAGLIGAELYARKRADDIVSRVVACVVQDSASASFGALPPFLVQHFSKHYSHISIETAGNQIRDAKGMQVKLTIEDVRLQDTADSAGTVGAMDVEVTWSTQGIEETIGNALPLVGMFVSGVRTDPADGTIVLGGTLGGITARPQVENGSLRLEVLRLNGLGISLPRETVQPMLDAFTEELTSNYPLGIRADSVQVTDSGVIAHFSTRDAAIPKGGEDPCFAGL
ncbi:DUF2993 domain-containing protein [uncultured Mycolicibacterium sp.]|uniref:LmeA family phospholipid-binding protein n=1 Tax=uncultured Mycolicibacterium sp. TaxID=2320817 RepID=UPI00262DE4ED|nr:DUF2993 domain-containing protein [uncultured Mycolicibacterium sp.]